MLIWVITIFSLLHVNTRWLYEQDIDRNVYFTITYTWYMGRLAKYWPSVQWKNLSYIWAIFSLLHVETRWFNKQIIAYKSNEDISCTSIRTWVCCRYYFTPTHNYAACTWWWPRSHKDGQVIQILTSCPTIISGICIYLRMTWYTETSLDD